MDDIDTCDLGYRVFGQPLALTRAYASRLTSMPFSGFRHDLPIVVCACVEELYRTGMTVPGLFRSPPDRMRHRELIELFDKGPTFGRSRSLSRENTADVCALLRSYIDHLPCAIWHEALFSPMLELCVRPSMLADASETEELNGAVSIGPSFSLESKPRTLRPTSCIIPPTPSPAEIYMLHSCSSSPGDAIPFSNSLPSTALSAMVHSEIDAVREAPQLAAAKALFRLLPRAQLALLAYLCAFFTQLPLCPHNQLAIEDVARLFAVPLFVGKPDSTAPPAAGAEWAERREYARVMMVWILRRWPYVSDGLFDTTDELEDLEDVLISTAASSCNDSEGVSPYFSGIRYQADPRLLC